MKAEQNQHAGEQLDQTPMKQQLEALRRARDEMRRTREQLQREMENIDRQIQRLEQDHPHPQKPQPPHSDGPLDKPKEKEIDSGKSEQ
jgi:chromosome segregation ATPase